MQNFNVELGNKELYTAKNFSFDLVNIGSADLNIENITLSNKNIKMIFTKTPMTVLKNKSFTFVGYLNIVEFGDSTNVDYMDLDIS